MSDIRSSQREAWLAELAQLEANHAHLLSLPEPPGHHKPLRTERIIQLKRWLKDSDPERPVSPATTEWKAEVVVRSQEYIELRWAGLGLRQGEMWERPALEKLCAEFNKALENLVAERLAK